MAQHLAREGDFGAFFGDQQPGRHVQGHAGSAQQGERHEADANQGHINVEVLRQPRGNAGQHRSVPRSAESPGLLPIDLICCDIHASIVHSRRSAGNRGCPGSIPEKPSGP